MKTVNGKKLIITGFFIIMPMSLYAASFSTDTALQEMEPQASFVKIPENNTADTNALSFSSIEQLADSMASRSVGNMETLPIPAAALLFGPAIATLIGLSHWRKSRQKRS